MPDQLGHTQSAVGRIRGCCFSGRLERLRLRKSSLILGDDGAVGGRTRSLLAKNSDASKAERQRWRSE